MEIQLHLWCKDKVLFLKCT